MANNVIYKNYVADKLDSRDVYEGLAEELAELQHAILKVIRAKKLSKNTTPVPLEDARAAFYEELVDVSMVLSLMSIDFCALEECANASTKWERWARRLGYTDKQAS